MTILYNKFGMCICSIFYYDDDDSYKINNGKNIEEVLNNPPTQFLKELTECIDFSEISDYGVYYTSFDELELLSYFYKIIKDLPDISNVNEIQYCLNFLEMENNDKISNTSLTILDFINDFLNIKQKEYQCILLNYLENMDYIDHGCNIIFPTLKNSNHILNPEIEKNILEWVEKY